MFRVPRTVWVLGFVSLLMDVSSEMIHAVLPLFMAGTLVEGLHLGATQGVFAVLIARAASQDRKATAFGGV